MSDWYHFKYVFHPVGQGLFASGALFSPDHSHPRFRWVYDCGTSSSQALIDPQFNRLVRPEDPNRRLELVTLSHFDHDHISGVSKLISHFAIDTLLLPYMPLWQRLLIAFEEGTPPSDPEFRFFITPADYVTALPGANIRRILFVQPGGQAPIPSPGPPSPWPGNSRDPWTFEPDTLRPDDPEEDRSLHARNSATQVRLLRKGASIPIGSLWEFVPYNDDLEEPVDEHFRNSVKAETALLLGSPSRKRSYALKRLKLLYDSQFGASSQQRNIISLFLYGGPIYDSWQRVEIRLSPLWHLPYGPLRPRPAYEVTPLAPGRHDPSGLSRCSILYTGDGYVDTPERLERMHAFLGTHRTATVGVFQVMHHGAEHNWHKGVAASISPRLSIFSSDPEHHKLRHPHAPVLRDFWPYGSVQVDKHRGVAVLGAMLSK